MNPLMRMKNEEFIAPPPDPRMPVCPFDNLLILDFEATTEYFKYDYPHEIIQIGATILFGPEWKTNTRTDFMEYVKPVINPTLSEACKQLTNITQKQVDEADIFPKVFKKFQKWLEDAGIAHTHFAVITDGRQDMWKLAQYQFIYWKMQLPVYFKRFIDAFRIFAEQTRMIPKIKIIYCRRLPTEEEKKAIKRRERQIYRKNRAARKEAERLYQIEKKKKDAEMEKIKIAIRQKLEEIESPACSDADYQTAAEDFEESANYDELNDLAQDLNGCAISEFKNFYKLQIQREKRKQQRLRKNARKIVSNLDRMCQRFGIKRDPRLHNALGDATTLRKCVMKMLDEGRKFFYNYVLTCEFGARGAPYYPPLGPNWRSDWDTSMRILERVLPLYCRRLTWQDVDAIQCRRCGMKVKDCGVSGAHLQFQEELFNGTINTFGPIECAVVLKLDRKYALTG